jgi:hypothetical protein
MKRLLTLLITLSSCSLFAQTYYVLLSTSQEVSFNTATGSAGFAWVELDGTTLTYTAVHEGTSGLTMAHFHGPAAAGTNAGVSLALSGTESPITATVELTPDQVSDLTSGLWYFNLHTSENPGGELRGQVVDQLPFVPTSAISGSQVVGGMSTAGAGAARYSYDMATRELSWDIAYEGLSSAVTMMHFHGPALPGANAGVAVNLEPISGIGTPQSGSAILTEEQANQLLAGEMYLNIHTQNNPGGEIRGQLSEIEMTWNGYPLDASGQYANTGTWMGWVKVDLAPWIWNLTLQKYLYVADGSGWVYIPRF